MEQFLRISLKAARINAGMTQKQAAEKITKVSGSYISREKIIKFEKNPEKIPFNMGKILSNVYNISTDNIFFSN